MEKELSRLLPINNIESGPAVDGAPEVHRNSPSRVDDRTSNKGD